MATTEYDSIVVAGAGIASLAFVARLARSKKFAGRISVVGPPMPESRRLIAGVSLRGNAADYLCQALGCTIGELLEHLTGNAASQSIATQQIASTAHRNRQSGKWQFTKVGVWQHRKEPAVYGVRNSRLQGAMRELMHGLDYAEYQDMVQDADHLRTFARGNNPLLVNVTNNSALLGNVARPSKHYSIAAQVPLKVKPSGLRAPFSHGTAFALLIRRQAVIDVGYFTPFADPLSPEAAFYGIVTCVLPVKKPFSQEEEIATLTDELFGLADVMGLEPVDPDQTLGTACVLGGLHTAPPRAHSGTLELKALYTAGPPAYYADGIVSCAVGGLVAAEAILAGKDPHKEVTKAIRPYRWYSWLWWVETTQIAAISELLMRLSVKGAMYYPHTWSADRWFAAPQSAAAGIQERDTS
jgi:hypothetical protein